MNLIAKIYEALDDDEALEALPDVIARSVGSRSCTLQLFSPEFELEGSWVNHFNGEMYEFYQEQNLQFHDAWTQTNLNVFGLNRTARHTDHLPLEKFRNSLFYEEFIRRFGDDSAYCLGFISTCPDGGYLVAGLQKAITDEDFTDEQVQFHESLRPHLTRMLALRRKLLLRENLAAGALLGIDSVENAYLVIRSDRRVLFANVAAEKLLQSAGLLKSIAGDLFFIREPDDAKLAQAIHGVSTNKIDGLLSFVARDKEGVPWRMMLAPKMLDGRAMLMIWIDRGTVGASAREAMAQLYRLSQAELNVLSPACEGLTAGQIADQLQIAVATVRTHLQHIYSKTGVNKVSQLATLVASLPKVAEAEP